jgi:hypothetical protein
MLSSRMFHGAPRDAIRPRRGAALAALGLILLLLPATPKPASAGIVQQITCPAGTFLAAGWSQFDVADLIPALADEVEQDDALLDAAYAFLLDDWYGYPGGEQEFEDELVAGAENGATEAELAAVRSAKLAEMTAELILGVYGYGSLFDAVLFDELLTPAFAPAPHLVIDGTGNNLGGRAGLRFFVETCVDSAEPDFVLSLKRIGAFALPIMLGDYEGSQTFTCEASDLSLYEVYPDGPGEDPLYRTASGWEPNGDRFVALDGARSLAQADAVNGAVLCTVGGTLEELEEENEQDGGGQQPVTPTASWLPSDGAAPQVAPGAGFWQFSDGSRTSLTTSSAEDGQVRFSADGLTVTLTGARGTSASNGLVVDPAGEIACEICLALSAGEVVESWLFSEPRLVAAHAVTEDGCHLFTIPLGAPLDGQGPVPTGAHTLQFVLPTASGMQAVNVGVTVGGGVPTSIPAGDGLLPQGTGPISAVLVLLGVAGGAAALRRASRTSRTLALSGSAR